MISPILVMALSALITATCASPVDPKQVIAGVEKVMLDNVEVNVDTFPGVGKYFKLMQQLNWFDAYKACQSAGANLVVINSGEEAAILRQLVPHYAMYGIHLGFNDLYVEGVYRTIDGNRINLETESDWMPGYPMGNEDYNCGAFAVSGMMDIYCSQLQYSICELPLWNDYDLLPGQGHYKYHPEELTWQEAWQVCESEGTHLLIPNSEDELSALAETYGQNYLWVGVHRLYGIDVFITVSNEPLESTGYSTWHSQAGNETTHPYVASYLDGKGLTTSTSLLKRPFICEKELHSH